MGTPRHEPVPDPLTSRVQGGPFSRPQEGTLLLHGQEDPTPTSIPEPRAQCLPAAYYSGQQLSGQELRPLLRSQESTSGRGIQRGSTEDPRTRNLPHNWPQCVQIKATSLHNDGQERGPRGHHDQTRSRGPQARERCRPFEECPWLLIWYQTLRVCRSRLKRRQRRPVLLVTLLVEHISHPMYM